TDAREVVVGAGRLLDTHRVIDARIVSIDLLRTQTSGVDFGDELTAGIDVAERVRGGRLAHTAALAVVAKLHRGAVSHHAVELPDAVPVVVLVEAGLRFVREIAGVVIGERIAVDGRRAIAGCG